VYSSGRLYLIKEVLLFFAFLFYVVAAAAGWRDHGARALLLILEQRHTRRRLEKGIADALRDTSPTDDLALADLSAVS